MKTKKQLICLLMLVVLLTACAPSASAQDPGLVFTVVASTQTAAAWQTQMAQASFSKTPTQATLRPTFTPFPTMTAFVYEVTPSPTPTPTASMTSTPPILTSWPDWTTGEVVTMPRGSGQNIGVNKRFKILVGVQVLITRTNGVKLRTVPSKAADGFIEVEGSALTLTGIMNQNKELGWFFVQVEAVNGKTYWVGGSGNENNTPADSFVFYYPHLTISPTPTVSETPTMTLTPSASATPTPSGTPTLYPSETMIP